MEQNASSARLTLGAKLRDGRHGPVFLAMDVSTGELKCAERLDLDEPALSKALDHLQQQQQQPKGSPADDPQYMVPCLGHHRDGDHTYLLTPQLPGGSLSDMIRQYGAMSTKLAAAIARGIVRGLERARVTEGLAVAFLDADHVWLSNVGTPMIEPPLLDVALAGQRLFPFALLTLPEIVSGDGGLMGADVWLLGVLVARMLSGRADLVADYQSATSFGAKVGQHGAGSALELLVSESGAAVTEDPTALDFVRQCLTMNRHERPNVSKLLEHPFIADEGDAKQ